MPQLDHDQFRRWKLALLDAFTEEASLAELVQVAYSRTLDEISTGPDLGVKVEAVVRRADADLALGHLLRAAMDLRPRNELLAQLRMDHRLLLELEQQDHFEAAFLRPPSDMAMIDRRTLRSAVRNLLDNPGGARVMVVDGESSTGKTYTSRYIGYLATAKRNFRFVWVDLERLPKSDGMVTVGELGRSIATQLKLDGMPAQAEQDSAWVHRFCDWLTGALPDDQVKRWIVIDSFRKVLVEQGVHSLIQELANRIELTLPDLRLTLLSYEERHRLELEPLVDMLEYEWISPIGDDELAEFFSRLHTRMEPKAPIQELAPKIRASLKWVRGAVPHDRPNRLATLSRVVAEEAKRILAGNHPGPSVGGAQKGGRP